MSEQVLWPYGGVLVATLLVWQVVKRMRSGSRSSGPPLPPGPKSRFLVGNMLDMPTEEPWLTYRDWSDVYGDVVYLDLPAQPTILVGSAEVAFELLERRSDIYSDRRMPIMLEMMAWGFNFAFMGYGPVWRAHRRSVHQYFSPNLTHVYQDIQLQEARSFLHRLLSSPEHRREHVRLMIVAIIVRIVYGKRVENLGDDFITLAHKAVEGLVLALVPGAYWVEYLPFLRHLPSWLPGNRAGKLTDAYRPIVQAMRDQPFDQVEASLAQGDGTPSVTATMIREIHEQVDTIEGKQVEEKLKLARNVTALAYSGTWLEWTTCAAEVFMLAMGMYPRVQRQAQEELDRVVGPNRLPDFDDLESLVYIRAIAMETMRWLPVNPFSVPRTSMAEDEYKGYRIPKGSTILVNAWAILHNPKDYPEPEEFRPERFIKDAKINPDIRDPITIAFGFGRRHVLMRSGLQPLYDICPGRFLSNASLTIYIASTLHVFNISPGYDKAGNRVKLTTDVSTGLVACVVLFVSLFLRQG
ncbi:cytochrome P450 [Cristinia sonorae]|uniref:Cytochrome P450 n=1 Tax=Cristinia sonorae TaxID=1940300 RepID=A0A8K0UK09_9AGAR|nr:cytochrome P450 [Cristinia sonorae]